MKIALVGAHGSGKSTILSGVYSDLKKQNIRVNLAHEVARQSLFLAAKEISPKMQMDLFGMQVSCEMTTGRNCDLLLCDRSVFDILMYTELFFPDDATASLFATAMRDFCKSYKNTYDLVFKTNKLYAPDTVSDEIRPPETLMQVKADEALASLLDEFEVKYIVLGECPVQEMLRLVKNYMRDRV